MSMGLALNWRAQRHWRGWLRALLLSGAVGVFMLPLVWTVLASFRVTPDDTAWPPTWTSPTLAKYTEEIGVAEPTFTQELTTSIGLSLTATLLTITVSFLAAYSLARSRFRGKQLLVQSCLILASLPVMAYIVPLSDTARRLRLEDTFIGVMLVQTAVNAPLAVYILYGYLTQVSLDLEEAARLDGATALQTLWGVVLPMATSELAATAIIVFVLNWNLFLVPLVLTTSRIKTIPVAMSDFFTFERELEWPTAAAALVVSLLPLVALVALAHRLLERFSLRGSGSQESPR